jgi:phospholipase/carboxylesterase
VTGPHQEQSLAAAGTPLSEAKAALVAVHGRGATARSILGTAAEVHAEGLAMLAPQAARNSWYPESFLAPVDRNEPGRSSGLRAVDDALAEADDAGIAAERVLLLGFSQGGCLACEYVARNSRRYGGLAVLSGGLIGERVDPDDYEGDLEGTPAFFGCSDVDPHIPEERVHDSAEVLERLNADVTTRIYEGMGHGVNRDELEFVSGMVERLLE